MRLRLAAALVLGAPAAALAQAQILAGFDVYRFGMAPQQVVELPNTLWTAPQTLTFQRPDGTLGMAYLLRAQRPIPFDGADFELNVFFDPQGGLNEVRLARNLGDRPVADCEREFQGIVKRFETRYGVFYPSLAPGRAQEDWRMEFPAPPGLRSRYALVTMAGQISGGAIRRYGPTSVGIGMTSDGRSTCGLAVQFMKKD